MTAPTPVHATLVAELRQLIADARSRVATAVNADLTALYWQVGQRIHRETLGNQRAGYGEEIVSAVGRQLTADCGRGFSAKNLHHMLRFAQAFPEEGSVSTLSRQLSWLAKHEQEPGENPPLGIILCTGKKQEQIELLELDKSGIHVAQYLTVLPSRDALRAKLQQSIAAARQRLLQDKTDQEEV
jgi:hypothetical protein